MPASATPQRSATPRLSTNRNRGSPQTEGRTRRSKTLDRGQLMEDHVFYVCDYFTRNTLSRVEPEVCEICHGALRSEFLSVEKQKTLEHALERVYNFLASLEDLLRKEHFESGPASVSITLPPKPKLVRIPPATWTEDEKRWMEDLKRQLREAKAQLKREQAEVTGLRRDLQRWLDQAEEQRRRVAAQLAKVQPALKRAQDGLLEVKDDHLVEVRSYVTPPPMVAKVMEAVLTLIGESKADEWPVIVSYVKKKEFMPTVREFGPEHVSEQARKRVRRLISDPGLTHENAYRASRAAAPLLVWVRAMVEYAEALQSVKPLQEQLDKLDREIAEAQAELDRRSQFGALTEIERLKNELKRFSDDELARRGAEQAHYDAERNRMLLSEWERSCQEMMQRAADSAQEMERQRAIPVSLSWMERTNEVIAVRQRCNVIIRAITATMDRLRIMQRPCPLVVQRGRLAARFDNTTMGPQGTPRRRRSEPHPAPGTVTFKVASPDSGAMHTPTSVDDATVAYFPLKQLGDRPHTPQITTPGRRSTPAADLSSHRSRSPRLSVRKTPQNENWYDPDHYGIELPREHASSGLVLVGTRESTPRILADGTIRDSML